MVKLKLDQARSTLIGKFMSDYLKLTTAENRVYNQAMATISPKEREEVLDLSNEWSESGARNMATRLMTCKFGAVPAMLKRRLGRLTESDLYDLGEVILVRNSIIDIENWVDTRLKKTR